MAARQRFLVGKLPPRILQAFLAKCPVPKTSSVVVGPRFGEDAAVIDLGLQYLVAKTDPITFTAEHIGWYAVNINANDVACLGARPRWFLATLLLPESGANAALAASIFRDILRACRPLGVTLCGGHTEITLGLQRPIVVGQMLGLVEKPKLIRKESQRPGDLILLSKGVALEGTAILAREKAGILSRRLGAAAVRRAARLLFKPGIGVVPEARIAARHGGVHALHDPTEGGLVSGLYELAQAGQVGMCILKEKIPILPETRAFAEVLGFDPLALIASGALLIVASRHMANAVLRALRRGGISAAAIGEVRPKGEGVCLLEHGKKRRLRVPERDEIARLL
jgi:hydrogenase expression/formation protein HypE